MHHDDPREGEGRDHGRVANWLQLHVAAILGHPPTASEIERVMKQHGSNETDHLCEACLETVKRDPDQDKLTCTDYGSASLGDVGKLAGRTCRSCKEGSFGQGALGAIS